MATEIQTVKSWPQRSKDYFEDLQTEMKRVTWPSRKQVESTTAVVIVTVFAFAAYFKVVDSAVNWATKWIFAVAK
ncbi:MAG: hypothetical protein NVS4B8_30990 [Herpetosiphon sp.]